MSPDLDLLIVVTGLSGAGRSTALRSLEDLGFEAIDNLPLSLLAPLLEQERPSPRRLAVGIDTRTRGLDPGATAARLQVLAGQFRYHLELVFVEASDTVLLRRFNVTRRRHPLVEDAMLSASISHERELLMPLRQTATQVIETSHLSPQDIKAILASRFGLTSRNLLQLTVMSFAYPYGLPPTADVVLDMRFLRNPHYVPELAPLTGRDPQVAQHISDDALWPEMLTSIQNLLQIYITGWQREGKPYATVAFGCTGGQHRSVFMAESMASWLQQSGQVVHLQHRDLKA